MSQLRLGQEPIHRSRELWASLRGLFEATFSKRSISIYVVSLLLERGGRAFVVKASAAEALAAPAAEAMAASIKASLLGSVPVSAEV